MQATEVEKVEDVVEEVLDEVVSDVLETPGVVTPPTPTITTTEDDDTTRRRSGSRVTPPAGLSGSAGQVLGATTGLGDSCEMLLKTYMKESGANDASEVTLLQTFLEMQSMLVMPTGVSKGFFGPITKNAVVTFQNKYADEVLKPWGVEAIGNVFKTTRWKINNINCEGSEAFPLIP